MKNTISTTFKYLTLPLFFSSSIALADNFTIIVKNDTADSGIFTATVINGSLDNQEAIGTIHEAFDHNSSISLTGTGDESDSHLSSGNFIVTLKNTDICEGEYIDSDQDIRDNGIISLDPLSTTYSCNEHTVGQHQYELDIVPMSSFKR